MVESPVISVSVIMPVHNAEEFLDETLSSFESQTFSPFELICVDDGSDDSSLDILRRHALADGRITVIQQENRGAGAARNRGLRAARGEHLLFADADDVIRHDAIEVLYEAAKASGADICACDADYLDVRTGKKGKFIRYDRRYCNRTISASTVYSDLFQIINGYPWGKLFKADFIKEFGLTFQEIPAHNDTMFVIGAYARARTIAFVNVALIIYRLGSRGSIQSNKAKHPLSPLEAIDTLRENLFADGIISSPAMRSFDEYCMKEAFGSFESLSYDLDAASRVYAAAKEIYLPKWGIATSDKKRMATLSPKLRFKLWCFERTSFHGYMDSRCLREPNARIGSLQKLGDGFRLLWSAIFKK